MMDKIKNLVKRAASQKPMKDDGSVPIVQVKYFNKTAFIEVLAPYGLCASPPTNSMATVINIGAQEENRTGIVDAPATRFKNLKEGEVVVGNYVTRAKIYFKENGDIYLHVPEGNLIADVDEGDVNLNVLNGEVTIDCPHVIMTGDLTVQGNISVAGDGDVTGGFTVTGDILDNSGTNSNTVREMREIYNVHEHPENDGGGPTDQPNESM